ncbi:hypothetical protein R3P38DRAFT_2785856 [Favolaschia claudopus]|uniref:Uncharacterized protein n=1 Tax=Favolaschia claudopus TaxID=2862362 RepID=A0AAW0AT67_9AGAR
MSYVRTWALKVLARAVRNNLTRAGFEYEVDDASQDPMRRAVRNNLTRAGFEYEVDDASQDPMKKAHWIQAHPQYVLREVWSNRNEWLDKTNKDPPTTNNNSGDSDDHGGEDDGQGGEDDDDDDKTSDSEDDSERARPRNAPSKRPRSSTAHNCYLLQIILYL